jgi:hypothetical protein
MSARAVQVSPPQPRTSARALLEIVPLAHLPAQPGPEVPVREADEEGEEQQTGRARAGLAMQLVVLDTVRHATGAA